MNIFSVAKAFVPFGQDHSWSLLQSCCPIIESSIVVKRIACFVAAKTVAGSGSLPCRIFGVGQIAGAYLFVAGETIAWGRLTLVLTSGVALYWAGMILNDLWDKEEDARDRPSRPIPSGQISEQQARVAGFGLLVAGVLLATGAGWVQLEAAMFAWMPAIIALLLATCIILYDGPLKSTWLAPATMGLCRLLCFLLGASAAVSVPIDAAWQFSEWFPPQVLVARSVWAFM